MAKPTAYFTEDSFAFLRDLRTRNEREWFEANRARYVAHVRDPAIRFIMDFAPRLRKISDHFTADPRPVGGSLFRIHRDTRFSKDRSPYKTHAGIRFMHARNRDVHAPAFYLHVEPDASFIGVGLWHPESPVLKKIRDAIVADPAAWKRARDDRRFRQRFQPDGESLTRPPRGYDADHPFIDDIRRKDFVAYCAVANGELTGPAFLETFTDACRDAAPFVRYLCGATDLAF